MAHIHQINVSAGGVPKLPLAQAMVTADGIQGDIQADLRHHGGPDRAVVLFSLELIQALQAEGHPIVPGSTGETVTVTGLNWDLVQPGARLRLGTEVVVEITDFASPCYKIGGSFMENEFGRISQPRYPGWSRMLARVLAGGPISPGEPVTLVNAASGE